MREGYIETVAGKVWYSVYGEGKSGTPILVVHGGPGFLSMPEVVSDFAEDRPVYFYDQLGCGKSDRAADNDYYSVQNYVNELDAVIEELKLQEVILMGFSWGCGLVCSYMLEKAGRRVKALILSAPYLSSPFWDKDQRDNIKRMPAEVIKAIEKGEKNGDYSDEYQEAMMEYYKKHVYNVQPWPDYMQTAFEMLNMDVYLTMWGPSEFTISGKLKNFDLFTQLQKIKVPVLLTCGDNDEAGVKSVKDYQMAFANAQMAVIPNATHLHQLEQPQIYKAVINGFLKNK